MNTSTAELTRTPMSQPVAKQPTMLGLFIKDVAMAPIRVLKPIGKILAYLAPSAVVSFATYMVAAHCHSHYDPDRSELFFFPVLASVAVALFQSMGSAQILGYGRNWDTFWIYRPIINYYINLKQRAGVQ